MNKKRMWRPLLLVLLVLFALAYVLPSLVAVPSWYPFTRKLNYGLDLKGGLELRYTVDYKKAIADNALRVREGVVQRIVDALAVRDEKDPEQLSDEERAAYAEKVEIERESFDALVAAFQTEEDADVLTSDLVRSIDPNYVRQKVDTTHIRVRLSEQRIDEIREQVVEQTLATIRKRVEAFGLVEPDVRQNGDTDIDVQLPGVGKAQMEMVRERIGQTAQLLFRMVDDEVDFFRDLGDELDAFKQAHPDRARTLELKCPKGGKCWLESEKKSELVGFLKTVELPDDHTVGFQAQETREGSVVTRRYFTTMYLKARVEVSGDTLSRAMVLYEQNGEPYVSLEFNSVGARKFADVTRENVDRRLAIMLDDEVNSAPVIQEEIAGGRARITLGGGRPPQEVLADARSLVTVLNQGAYRAPVHKIHDFEVGPSLGRDSIRAGTMSLLVGGAFVILFILIYYRRAGIIANIALALNVLFILAVLVSFNTALTLPGLAGIVLTIGMAIDANVIIFERIREELRAGRSPRAAVDTGYSRAFWTIFDANITTALAGVILLNYTTGPVQGFAKTLLIGIATSMFTAIVVTRMIFRFFLERKRMETLSI